MALIQHGETHVFTHRISDQSLMFSFGRSLSELLENANYFYANGDFLCRADDVFAYETIRKIWDEGKKSECPAS